MNFCFQSFDLTSFLLFSVGVIYYWLLAQQRAWIKIKLTSQKSPLLSFLEPETIVIQGE